MTTENESTGVNPDGAGVVTPTTVTPETVSSPEVNRDAQSQERTPESVQKNIADISKMQEQIDNLNAALRQERESGKAMSAELKEKLERSEETISKLKSVFSPEQPVEESVPEILTLSQVEEMLERREREKIEESKKKTQAEIIQAEIKELETEWNGQDGKPLYDDKKVLEWQEANNKLHLTPREAFNIMSRDSIVDWEIKNRMSKKPPVHEAERPGAVPTGREPQERVPENASDLRSAVLEAMENASFDNSY